MGDLAMSELQQCRHDALKHAAARHITRETLDRWIVACERLYTKSPTLRGRVICLWHKLVALVRGDTLVFCRHVEGDDR